MGVDYLMQDTLLIIFDIDDVLNNLMMTTLEIIGVPEKYDLKKRYYVEECPEIFTADQKETMRRLWKDGNTYRLCKAQPGIEKLNKLLEIDNVDLKIHSFCASEDAANAKGEFIKSYINICDGNLNLELNSKTPYKNAFVVVEDHFQYLCKTDSKYKLLIDKPYNKAEEYGTTDKEQGILRFNSTNDAIEFIMEVL